MISFKTSGTLLPALVLAVGSLMLTWYFDGKPFSLFIPWEYTNNRCMLFVFLSELFPWVLLLLALGVIALIRNHRHLVIKMTLALILIFVFPALLSAWISIFRPNLSHYCVKVYGWFNNDKSQDGAIGFNFAFANIKRGDTKETVFRKLGTSYDYGWQADSITEQMKSDLWHYTTRDSCKNVYWRYWIEFKDDKVDVKRILLWDD